MLNTQFHEKYFIRFLMTVVNLALQESSYHLAATKCLLLRTNASFLKIQTSWRKLATKMWPVPLSPFTSRTSSLSSSRSYPLFRKLDRVEALMQKIEARDLVAQFSSIQVMNGACEVFLLGGATD